MALTATKIKEIIEFLGTTITFTVPGTATFHPKLGTKTSSGTPTTYTVKAVVEPNDDRETRERRGITHVGDYTFYIGVGLVDGLTSIPDVSVNDRFEYQTRTFEIIEVVPWGICDNIVLFEVLANVVKKG